MLIHTKYLLSRRLQSNLTQITAFSNVILRYILHLLSQQTECQHVTNYQNTARILNEEGSCFKYAKH